MYSSSSMQCLVTQPNSSLIEVWVDFKSKGQECLDKVCEQLGIRLEQDYFGLQYHGPKGEDLWLNLRNPIRGQVTGSSPVKLALKVKFWVPPHMLQQDATRLQFYSDLCLLLRNGQLVCDEDNQAVLLAYIRQVETGDVSDDSEPEHYLSYLNIEDHSPMVGEAAQMKHRQFKGMSASSARYWFLMTASNLPHFGLEMFHARHGDSLTPVVVGVGPIGITIMDHQLQVEDSVPYATILQATYRSKEFHLSFINQKGEQQTFCFRMETSAGSISLYRAVTEKHAFYSCDTVRSAVTTQFIRDFKGTIVSLFNENSALGKNYMFDVRRTHREVYDNARRQLFATENRTLTTTEMSSELMKEHSAEISEKCNNRVCKDIQSQLSSLMEALSCCICRDKEINAVFCPCFHASCCLSCAELCETCPLCRSDVKEACQIYLPITIVTRPETDLPVSKSYLRRSEPCLRKSRRQGFPYIRSSEA